MNEANGATSAPHAQSNGRVFRWAFADDLLLNIIWRGSERTYREKTVELAEIRPCEAVPDIGCGTGTLKANGRLLLIDFGGSKRERHSLIGHLRAHSNFDVFDVIPTINESGLTDLKNGSLGFSDLQFLIATRSGSTSLRSG
ncbi:hypothetical protein [Bradyrhizobium sp. AZCC 2289]|uniref:hypothetical protein n=1 Tax=Bradyrhizobium sp. AZCC 2289 TaxID=3117026 RepID=UPI002FF39E58